MAFFFSNRKLLFFSKQESPLDALSFSEHLSLQWVIVVKILASKSLYILV